MRNDLVELWQTQRRRVERPTAPEAATLAPEAEPMAIDAALADEATPIVAPAQEPTQRGSRRDDAHAQAVASMPHAGDEGLMRQLSRQLDMLEIQQRQIRRLLEQNERRATTASVEG
jgi:hypothetical protein